MLAILLILIIVFSLLWDNKKPQSNFNSNNENGDIDLSHCVTKLTWKADNESITLKQPSFDVSKIKSYDNPNQKKFEFRPQTFDQFIGQEEAKERAKTIIKKVRIGMKSHIFIDGMQGCFVAGTKILMADYTWTNIENIKEGDKILGFDEHGFRRVYPTIVLNIHKRKTEELIYIKSDKSEVWTTPEHPFLISNNNHSRWLKASYVNAYHNLYYFPMTERNLEWYRGWILGLLLSDGNFSGKRNRGSNKQIVTFYNKNLKLLSKYFRTINKLYRVHPTIIKKINGVYQISINSRLICRLLNYQYNTLLNSPSYFSKDFLKGFIGGFYDGDGGCGKRDCPRIFNVDLQYIETIEKILKLFDFKYNRVTKNMRDRWSGEKINKLIYHISINNSSKFFSTFIPFTKIYYGGINKSEKQYIWLKKRFSSKPHIGFKKDRVSVDVYNLTTSSKTFIANGFPVHNCGKTSFIEILARSIPAKLISRVGRQIDEEEVVNIINEINCANSDFIMLFIDEVDSCKPEILKIFNPIIESFSTSGKGIRPFIFAGATINKYKLIKTNPDLLDRIPHHLNFDRYNSNEIKQIIIQYKDQLYPEKKVNDDIQDIISKNCKFNPRISLGLLEDFIIEQDINKVMHNSKIVKDGLTIIDIDILKVLSEAKRPMGANNLATKVKLSEQQYCTEFEPYLVSCDYVNRVPSRIITDKGRQILEEIK
jgi:Holliday junction resolvasome RuvABC ATP-dependent DNA helicase subunit